MAWETLQSVWVPLAIVGYLLIAGILKATAGHVNKHVARHDRVRAAKIRRLQYMRELENFKSRLDQTGSPDVAPGQDELTSLPPAA